MFFDTYFTEFMSIFQLLVSWVILFLFTFKFGKVGVYVYVVVAVILSNIQVLKFGHFFWTDSPVALGTVIFSSTFLATDILTEFYSQESAKTSITLGFLGFAFFSVLMLIQLWIPAVSDAVLTKHNLVDGHNAMKQLFSPAPALYASSLISYLISERIDIILYVMIKELTGGKALWLRSFLAATISALIDTAIFSILAFKIFAIQPISWSVLMFTYILGSFWPRIFISISGIPLLYLLKRYKMSWLWS